MTSGKCRLPDAARRIEGACVRRERWLGGAGPYGGEECLSMRFRYPVPDGYAVSCVDAGCRHYTVAGPRRLDPA